MFVVYELHVRADDCLLAGFAHGCMIELHKLTRHTHTIHRNFKKNDNKFVEASLFLRSPHLAGALNNWPE